MPDIVATTQAVPDPPPLTGIGHYGDAASWVITGAAGVLGVSLWFRRRFSRDRTEIVKDRAEANLVLTLREERDQAMKAAAEAWDRRTKDAQAIAKLSSENEFLRKDVDRLGKEVEDLKSEINSMRQTITELIGRPPSSPQPA